VTAARHSPTRGCWELQIAGGGGGGGGDGGGGGGGGAEGGGISSFDALVLAVPDTALGAAAVRSIGTAGASDEAARRTTRCRDELRLNEHVEWTAPPSSRALGPALISTRCSRYTAPVLSVHCRLWRSANHARPPSRASLHDCLIMRQSRDHLIRKESRLSIRTHTQAAEAEQEALATLAASLDGVVRPDPRDGPHISPHLLTSPHSSPYVAPHLDSAVRPEAGEGLCTLHRSEEHRASTCRSRH